MDGVHIVIQGGGLVLGVLTSPFVLYAFYRAWGEYLAAKADRPFDR